jgi:hypothetical protein
MKRLFYAIALAAGLSLPAVAQDPAKIPDTSKIVPPMDVSTLKNYLPIGRPADLKPSAVPDLSGDWAADNKRGGFGQSLSAADPGGRMRGKEPDIKYLPWALQRTLAENPPTGPDAKYEVTTDPQMHYCEPHGVGRIYMHPVKARYVQTPEAVYILHEMGPAFRIVWMQANHPEDPDPQYWGHSIGWYEGGDTLVVDTVGFNDRSWLDQVGHPHTEKLHTIERFKRIGADVLEYDITIDDPGAYAAPWPGHRNFIKSTTGFMRYMWVCSVRDNNEHYQNTFAPGNDSGVTTFGK